MIDLELVDRMFEIGHQHGKLIAFINFDKRALLPLEQVATDMSSATGKSITREDLTRMGTLGWIPLLSNPHDPEAGIGIPLYAPTRIELLLELEREGYSAAELRAIAECEEVTIDYVLTTEELTYIDDDLTLVIQHMRDMLLHAEQHESDEVIVDLSGASISRAQFQRKLLRFEQFQTEGVPEQYQYLIRKIAFRVRAMNEVIRMQMLEMDRVKVRSGYSPFVCCGGEWRWSDENCRFTAKKIMWDQTIKSAVAHAEDDLPTIRVPGFLLCGDKVLSIRTLTPKDYEQFWKQHDLDRYLLTWSTLQGEKRCLNCLSKLTDSLSGHRMYCGEKCRNAMKQKRHRQKNPEAVFEAQRKYWSSFDN